MFFVVVGVRAQTREGLGFVYSFVRWKRPPEDGQRIGWLAMVVVPGDGDM